jgi:hypothetical protein
MGFGIKMEYQFVQVKQLKFKYIHFSLNFCSLIYLISFKSMNGKHELLIPNSKLDDAGSYSFVIGDNKWDANVEVKG